MTHIPGQMLEILKQRWSDAATQDQSSQVHIIDLRKLKLLNHSMTTTQSLATEITSQERYHYHKNRNGLKGISAHHWLAQQWIPTCCILGSVTIKAFRDILFHNDIKYSKSMDLRGCRCADCS
jgi:hypothetical protein